MFLSILVLFSFEVICVLLSVAFFTLLERKVLSYSQLRKGPNKVSFLGYLQPVSDGIKLIFKFNSYHLKSKVFIFLVSPFLSFILMCTIFLNFPVYFTYNCFFYSLILFLSVSAMKVYPLLLSGWSSNAKYSLLGSFRGVCQVISYEVFLITMVLSLSFFSLSYNFKKIFSNFVKFFDLNFVLVFFLFCSLVMETNRQPFDFSEGESELVSGFNTEYSGLPFAFLFLGEYGNIMGVSLMWALLLFSKIFYVIPGFFSIFFFVMIRSSFPRFRYDTLMETCWKVFLPVSLISMLLFF